MPVKWPAQNTMFDLIASHMCCDMWVTVSALYNMLQKGLPPVLQWSDVCQEHVLTIAEKRGLQVSDPNVFKVQLNQLKRLGILELRKLPTVDGIGSEGWQWRLTEEARKARPHRPRPRIIPIPPKPFKHLRAA